MSYNQNYEPNSFGEQEPSRNNYQPNNFRVKEPFINYLFVTSLIIMILLAFHSLSCLGITKQYNDLLTTARNQGVSQNIISVIEDMVAIIPLYIAVTVLSFVALLVLFIFVIMLKNKNRAKYERQRIANIVLILSIISLCACALYFIVDCVFMSMFNELVELAPNPDELEESVTQMYVSIATVGTFVGLLIAAIVKVNSFKKFVNSLPE